MIPEEDRIIQGLWVEGKLSVMEELCIRSFLAHGHEFHLYTYGDVPNTPAGATVKDAREILSEDRIFRYENGFGKGGLSGFANVFRLHLLFQRGGWWVDMDIICLRPFDFGREALIGTSWEPGQSAIARANNCVLKSRPGDVLIKYCLEICESIDMSTVRFGDTGPNLIKRAVDELGMTERLVSWETFCPIGYRDVRMLMVPWYERFVLGRLKPGLTGRPQARVPKKARAIHLWNEMWRHNNFDKRGKYPASSIYERLKKQYLG